MISLRASEFSPRSEVDAKIFINFGWPYVVPQMLYTGMSMLCSTTVCLESKTTKITRCIFTGACVAFLSGAWFESRICADPTLVWNPLASRNVLKSMLTTAGLCFVPVLGLSLLDPSQGRGVRTLPGAVWEIFWILMSRI